MSGEVWKRRDVLDAVRLLRESGVTAEEYAEELIGEWWSVGGVDYPSREEAFRNAQLAANLTGESVEVWWRYGQPDPGDAYVESWIVKPERSE